MQYTARFGENMSRNAILYAIALLTGTVLIFAFPASVRAQNRPMAIGLEDVLTITIYAGGQLETTSNVTVSAEGIIDAPFIGPVQVAGLTPSQLEQKIAEPLARDFFVDPKVHVSIKEFKGISYYISGSVNSPGLYEMASKTSLLELIARAGGISASAGNVAFIMRGGGGKITEEASVEDVLKEGEPVKVDIGALMERGDQTQNPVLVAGDVIYVPPKQALNQSASKVYVEGMVESPGIYDYQPGMTALGACIMAGGFAQFSAPGRTKIFRKKGEEVEVVKVNLYKVRDGKTPDIELKPGDRIFIPETWF